MNDFSLGGVREIDDIDGIAERRIASRSIARMGTSRELTPQQSTERSIIHRSDVARPEVDAFRELRTRLLATADGNFVTLVAPVSRGAGGSFVARNLAAAFAFDDSKSALLVDCDLRHPSQHTTMKVDIPRGGLIDYLEDLGSDIAPVLYDTGVPRLRLLPVGRLRENGVEYFSSFRMRLLIDSLRSRYPDRYLFLDSPPVNGGPDARILADLADAVVLVAGYGKDTPAAISRAAASFDPAKFAGVVFNQGV
ncbi:polysaccharide biosynthesis protein [Lysobacter sp. H21R4]|uniref:polysaccharide biosynthesis protein n=1 Tax=Lysobacter sp. H21R4 TaxID=2781021 RepID=UPI0018876101|nr:polysaccharide biosynthesis protein [Lysobacter sp. H21R4]QOY61975.1 polysaccharide biosynthesis protein [Lysobacter sp. H21R4]